jgi:hypothetical protein
MGEVMRQRDKFLPRHMYGGGMPETVDLGGAYSARIKLVHDADHGAPWDEQDGHGPVSDWRDKDSKRAGERVLVVEDRRSKARFYDFAAAVKIAKRDGWGTAGDEGLSKGAKAARAVEADFKYLQGWCNDQWHYVGVVVALLREDEVVQESSCWGVESIGDYWRDIAAENLAECRRMEAKARRQARRDAREARRLRDLRACLVGKGG